MSGGGGGGGGGGAFFDQFIEDYFAECDEHLATVRRVLLALEGTTAGAPAPPLHELLRSLHTLKGLSGMVGDTCAERVAHALEDLLRAVERAGESAAGDPELLDALFAGVDAVERCVAAHRAGASPPDVDGVLAQLAALAPVERPTGPREAAVVGQDVGADAIVHQFEFVPTAALTARGVSRSTSAWPCRSASVRTTRGRTTACAGRWWGVRAPEPRRPPRRPPRARPARRVRRPRRPPRPAHPARTSCGWTSPGSTT